MRIFGVDPGSARTGYGCIDSDGSRHRVIACGALSVPARIPFSEKLESLYTRLADLLSTHRPDALAVEDLFYAKNVRSALVLGHVRGIVLLAGARAGIGVSEYTPTQVKRAVVGYGRAEKHQVQEMIRVLLGMSEAPSPFDVSDALAVAVCHAHTQGYATASADELEKAPRGRSWRQYRLDRPPSQRTGR